MTQIKLNTKQREFIKFTVQTAGLAVHHGDEGDEVELSKIIFELIYGEQGEEKFNSMREYMYNNEEEEIFDEENLF